MDEASQIVLLKNWLLEDIGRFGRSDRLKWKKPIVATVQELRGHHWPAVYFGGTLRSILLGRLAGEKEIRPRDIDIVVGEISLLELEAEFGAFTVRKTRFGGLHLKRARWEFDIWPVHETHAFKQLEKSQAVFEQLPYTTFFNLEAIAADVWSPPGLPRRLYAGDDAFFVGVVRQEIEVNNPENPFPELCVVRAMVSAATLNWNMGPQLLQYVARVAPHMRQSDWIAIQKKHYGHIRVAPEHLLRGLTSIMDALHAGKESAFRPFFKQQLSLWPEEETYEPRIRLRAVEIEKRREKEGRMRAKSSKQP